MKHRVNDIRSVLKILKFDVTTLKAREMTVQVYLTNTVVHIETLDTVLAVALQLFFL